MKTTLVPLLLIVVCAPVFDAKSQEQPAARRIALLRPTAEKSNVKPAPVDSNRVRWLKGLTQALQQHNLIADGAFEGQFGTLPSYVWLALSDAVQVETAGRGATRLAHSVLVNDIGKPREIEQSVNVKPFTHYALAAHVQTAPGKSDGLIQVRSVAGDSDPEGSPAAAARMHTTLVHAPVTSADGMHEVRFEFDTPAASWLFVDIGVDGSAPGSWVRIDDVSLIEMNSVVTNGSFEGGGTSWFSSPSAAVTPVGVHSGRAAMLVRGASDWNATNQWLSVAKHETYRVSAWLRPSAAVATSYVSIYGNAQESSFSVINEAHLDGPGPKGSPNAYHHVTFDFDSGNNSVVLLDLGFFGKGNDATLAVDDISVTSAIDYNATVDWTAPAGTFYKQSLSAKDGTTFVYHCSDTSGVGFAIGKDRRGVVHRLQTKASRGWRAFNASWSYFENDKPTLAVAWTGTTQGFMEASFAVGPAGHQGVAYGQVPSTDGGKTAAVTIGYWEDCQSNVCKQQQSYQGTLDLHTYDVVWSGTKPPASFPLDSPGLDAGAYFQPLFDLQSAEADARVATGVAWFDASHWYDHTDADYARLDQAISREGAISAIKWVGRALKTLNTLGGALSGSFGGLAFATVVNNLVLDPTIEWLTDIPSDFGQFCEKYYWADACQVPYAKTY